MKHQIKNSCGGQGCSKDLFTLPYCGGKRNHPRRLRTLARRKANKPWKMKLLMPVGIPAGFDTSALFVQYMPI